MKIECLDPSDCYIDAIYANGRGDGLEIGNTTQVKPLKAWQSLIVRICHYQSADIAANHLELKRVQLSFDFYMIEAMADALIGDRAYDSDDLDDD